MAKKIRRKRDGAKDASTKCKRIRFSISFITAKLWNRIKPGKHLPKSYMHLYRWCFNRHTKRDNYQQKSVETSSSVRCAMHWIQNHRPTAQLKYIDGLFFAFTKNETPKATRTLYKRLEWSKAIKKGNLFQCFSLVIRQSIYACICALYKADLNCRLKVFTFNSIQFHSCP